MSEFGLNIIGGSEVRKDSDGNFVIATVTRPSVVVISKKKKKTSTTKKGGDKK